MNIGDTQFEIIKHLPMYEIVRLTRVNRSFANLLRNTNVWTYLLKRDFNIETNENPEGKILGSY